MKVVNRHSVPSMNRRETWEFRLLLAFTLLVFLPIAAGSRLLPRSWRPLAAFSDESEGIYVEARRAAGIVIPCVFMG
jgi:hypothetical protein